MREITRLENNKGNFVSKRKVKEREGLYKRRKMSKVTEEEGEGKEEGVGEENEKWRKKGKEE